MSEYNSIDSKNCAIQLKNKIERVRDLENEVKILENENFKLTEQIKKLQGNLTIVLMDKSQQEVILKHHAMDKPIGNIYLSLKLKGYDISIDDIQAVVSQIDELPRELREYYEYEKEYYKNNKLNSSTDHINQSLNNLEFIRDLTTVRLVKLGEAETMIDPEAFDKMWNNAMNILMKTNQTIAKLRQEDSSYKIELSQEMRESGRSEMNAYSEAVENIVNINDIIGNSSNSIVEMDTRDILYDGQ